MKKIITTLLLSFNLIHAFAQKETKLTTCLFTEYNKTIYDRTSGNNPWGIGLGLQTFFSNKTKFKPAVELTGDIYLADDKVLRLNIDGTIPVQYNDVRGMINLFAGCAFYPVPNIYISFIGGPAFINGQTLLGVKPSFGFHFSKSKKWTGKISFINIFNRDKRAKEDFDSIGLAIGVKLF